MMKPWHGEFPNDGPDGMDEAAIRILRRAVFGEPPDVRECRRCLACAACDVHDLHLCRPRLTLACANPGRYVDARAASWARCSS